MADPRVTLTAFKEWACVIRALEEGDQICLIRLGKKDEERFSLKRRRFWLVPTYEHQEEEKIQPLYRDYISETEQQKEEHGDSRIRVASWVEARTLLKIEKNERLNWLTDYVVYSPRCLQRRFQTQPNEAVHLLVVRAYNLPDPRSLDAYPEYSECSRDDPESAWTQLQQRIPLQADNPAVEQAEFEQRKEEIRNRFVREHDEAHEPLMF